MVKGRILILVLTFLAIFWPRNVQAESLASACSMASAPICGDPSTQVCAQIKKEEAPQVQSSVIIASPKEDQVTIESQTEAIQFTLDSDKIFELINQYRTSLGLTPFEREESVCQLAQVRSTELAGELANGTIHSGLYNRNLPYWIWENAKVGSNEEETVNWWLASPLHHQSIVGDYKYSCVKCTGNNCSELFTSFVLK